MIASAIVCVSKLAPPCVAKRSVISMVSVTSIAVALFTYSASLVRYSSDPIPPFTEHPSLAHASPLVDVYTPEKHNGTGPLVVFVHGGAWCGGTHREHRVYGHAFLGRALAQGPDAVMAAIVTHPLGCIPNEWPYYGIGLVATMAALVTILFLEKLPSEKSRMIALSAVFFLYFPLMLFMESQECKQEPVSNLQQIESVEGSIRQLNAHDIVLAGHSSGGQIAAMITLRGNVPNIRAMIGVAGVYDLVGLHESHWPLNLIFDYMYLAPVFDLRDLAQLSPQQALATVNCGDEASVCTAVRTKWWVVSGHYDHDILIRQADRFYEALYQSGTTVARVRDIGLGHGMGLIRTREFVNLVKSIATSLCV